MPKKIQIWGKSELNLRRKHNFLKEKNGVWTIRYPFFDEKKWIYRMSTILYYINVLTVKQEQLRQLLTMPLFLNTIPLQQRPTIHCTLGLKKIQYPCTIKKILSEPKIEGSFFNWINSIYKKLIANSLLRVKVQMLSF